MATIFNGSSHSKPVGTNPAVSNQVQGTRFQDVLNANPYTEMPRQRTSWDQFLNWLGFRSGYDKAQEQYNLASQEYQAQVSQLASEEAYNSPLQQAQRMREAGLNPDLTGVSGEPASEFDNQQTPPDISAGTDVNPVDVISHIGQGFLSAISGTVGILSDVNLLKQARIATDTKDLEYADNMMDFLLKSDSLLTNYDDKDDPSNVASFSDRDKIKGLFHSSKALNSFLSSRNTFASSLMQKSQRYKNFDDYYTSRFNVANHISQPWYQPVGDDLEWEIAGFLREFNRIGFEALKGQKNAELWRAKKEVSKDTLEANAYDKLNAPDSTASDDMAESIQEGFKASTARSRTDQAIAPLKIDSIKIQQRILNGLQKYADKDGSIGAQILSMLLSSKIAGVSIFGPVGDAVSDVAGVAKKLIP